MQRGDGTRERSKSFAWTALRLCLTALFVALAVKAVRWDKMAEAIRHTSFVVVFTAALVYAGLQCLSATRWWSIARASGMRLRWREAVAAFYTGMFFNLFLPGLVGGDAVRAWLAARKTNHSLATSLGIVYADRTVGFIAMLLVGTWGAATLHLTHRQLVWQPLLWGALFAIGVTAALVGAALAFSRLWKGDWGERLARFANGIIAFLLRPSTGLQVFGLSLTYHLLLTANLLLLGRAAGIDQPFSAFAVVVAVATVIGSLPITLHGLGVRELASVKLWGVLQVTPEQAMLWALLWRVMTWLVSLPGGLVYAFWADKTMWRDLSQLAKQEVQLLRTKESNGEPVKKASDPFTLPKDQRVETAIATLEQLLEETEDETIRQALQQRLDQLRLQRRRAND